MYFRRVSLVTNGNLNVQGASVELSDGSIRRYRGCLVSFLGDTPASSLVGGFKEGIGYA